MDVSRDPQRPRTDAVDHADDAGQHDGPSLRVDELADGRIDARRRSDDLLSALPLAVDRGLQLSHEPDEAIAGGMISVADLHLTYRGAGEAHAALRGVTIDVREGDFLALLGPSG